MRLPAVETAPEFIPFAGGLDVVTPPLAIPPGYCRAAQNFEIDINGGYATIAGYERFDGRDKPSDASYAILAATVTAALIPGDILTDNTGAASGVVIATPDGQVVLTKLVGTFATGVIKVGGVTVGTCVGPQVIEGATSPRLQAQYKHLAANQYRDDIAAVPGSGPVRGVHVYADNVYAFRDNAGATAVDMYRATPAGWVKVALGRELAFTSGGTTEIVEGNTITGATSGATAVVTRVVRETGSWAAGDAAGRLIFATQTGDFVAETLNVGGSTDLATIAGNSSAITFAIPGGRFVCLNKNFGGGVATRRMYGVDGKNRGFEFDGTVFVPIRTGMVNDTPEYLAAHKNHLFYAFKGSVQHSGIGQPYSWTAVTGAAELAMGDAVTGFQVQAGSESGGALAILTRNEIGILYGSSVADWNLVTYSQEAGALPHSIQHIGITLMFDDRGITSLTASQDFGNFADATISPRIQPWLRDKHSRVSASCIARDKNQYRLFFSDRYAIYATMQNRKLLGFMPVLFAHPVRCVTSAERSDGSEALFFGSDDGFVYQMERGTSFDGKAIEAYVELAFCHMKSPRAQKHFRGATFEVSGAGYAEFDFSYELGYGSTEVAQPLQVTVPTDFSAVKWDAFVWDAFVWDGRTLSPSECDMEGSAENVSLKIRSNSDYFSPTRFSGALVDFSNRRRRR